jgi:hypothetical protein
MTRKSPDAFEHYLFRIKADMARFYTESGKEKEGIECLSKCLKKRDLLPDLGARSFAALGMAQEKIQDRREAAESYLSAAATYFILLRKGVRCLDDVYENLQKAKEIGAEENKGDIEVIIAAMKKLEGKGVRVPEGKTSERGKMLRSALEGNIIKSRSQTDNAIDEMILILIGDLSLNQIRDLENLKKK